MDDIYEDDSIVPKIIKRKNTAKAIDLSDINFDDELKAVALDIYKTYGVVTHKGIHRQKILFGCFILAGIRLGRPLYPKYVMEVLNLDPKQYSGCDRQLSEIRRKLGDAPKIFTPLDLARMYLETQKTQDGKNKYDNSFYLNLVNKWNNYKEIDMYDLRIVASWLLLQLEVSSLKNLCSFYGINDKEVNEFGRHISTCC